MKKILFDSITGRNDSQQGNRVFLGVLRLLSFFYVGVVRLRNFFYAKGWLRSYQLGKPVISVGNLTLGGTGKTPLVIKIAEEIKRRGWHPCVLTRGYMAEEKQGAVLSDEVQVLRSSLDNVPVGAGPDRIKTANQMIKTAPIDAFVMDDGFQHLKVFRDLNIVVVDATNPFGNGYVLPRGYLREPKKAVRRADLVVLTKTDWAQASLASIRDEIEILKPGIPVIETIHEPVECCDLWGKTHPLEGIRHKEAGALSSIGDPQGFEDMLSRLGVSIQKTFRKRDHHRYAEHDIQRILSDCRTSGLPFLLTTHKDAVKLEAFKEKWPSDVNCWFVKIQIKILKGEHELFSRISHLFDR